MSEKEAVFGASRMGPLGGRAVLEDVEGHFLRVEEELHMLQSPEDGQE